MADKKPSSTSTSSASEQATPTKAGAPRTTETGRPLRPDQVLVFFKAAAGAPQLKDHAKKIKCKTSWHFGRIMAHVRKLLKDRVDQSLFMYVSSNHISPAADETLANLTMMFGRVSAKGNYILEVDYSVTPAWG